MDLLYPGKQKCDQTDAMQRARQGMFTCGVLAASRPFDRHIQILLREKKAQ